MRTLSGVTILLVWIVWTIILAALSVLLGPIGIAVTLPTSVVIGFSRTLGLILFPVLYAPPLVLTCYWWWRRRHAGPPPG